MNFKRYAVLVCLCMLFNGCGNLTRNITIEDINISIVNRHPFLIDHGRKLVVSQDTHTIGSQVLYPDPGSGCDASLFEENERFILIDCNGNWYGIDKARGKIYFMKWEYPSNLSTAELPSNYMGTFNYSKENDIYEFEVFESLSSRDVYKFKDPPFSRH